MNIKLKETKDLDYENVVNLFFEVGFLKHKKHKEKRQQYREAIEKGFRNSQYVVSAWDKNELVAFVRILTDEVLFATVWNMIVKPKYQRRKIGTMMMNKCFSKYPNLHFFLIADEKVAKFYEKVGFKIHTHGMYLEKGKKVCVIYN